MKSSETRPARFELEPQNEQFEAAKQAFDQACTDFDQQMGWERAWVNPTNWGTHPRRGQRIYKSDMFASGEKDGRNLTADALRQTHKEMASRFEALSSDQKRQLVPWPTFSLKRDISKIKDGFQGSSPYNFLSQNRQNLNFDFCFSDIAAGQRAGAYFQGFGPAKRQELLSKTNPPRVNLEELGRSWLVYHQNFVDSVSWADYFLTYGVYQFGSDISNPANGPYGPAQEAVKELDSRLSDFYINTIANGDQQTERLLADWIWRLNDSLFQRCTIHFRNHLMRDTTNGSIESAFCIIGREVINIGRRGAGLNACEWD